MTELHYFDPRNPTGILERKLPHWSQAGVVCFITFRMNDSIPSEVLRRWRADRIGWLVRHGVSLHSGNWRQELQQLDEGVRKEFYQQFSQRWHDDLDACHGACLLRRPELAAEVEQSFRKFDDDRYEMFDFVVMPNHVHLLAAFAEEDSMLKQCDSWKHFTARQINLKCGTRGRFWQQDGFDHLVRSAEQFEHFRRYIADNPSKARLPTEEFIHYSKPLTQSDQPSTRRPAK
ncbi:MAG: putative transposase [Planctomycetaceae bacterium]|jgi:putative transposase